jgi:glycosyltransferase involved in cell wall biosynthesis
MKALHVVKTSEGAAWAAFLSAELVQKGVEVHVAVPRAEGRMMPEWKQGGAIIHVVDLDFPIRAPWRLRAMHAAARRLVAEVAPDIIHTYHVGPTLVLRQALGRDHPVRRIFHVPGPLHLEHAFYRKWEISTAGPNDWWIGSSACIVDLYLRAGIPPERVFLSYLGIRIVNYSATRTYPLRNLLGIGRDKVVVGNINFIYGPKYHLGQTIGLKCHEDIIDTLAIVTRKRADIIGVLAGGAWGGAAWYEKKLRAKAERAGGDRIKMPGYLPLDVIKRAWADFDCAVHVPLSENCGGVLEPLLAGVPTIAGRVGGLPEVVIEGVTGKLVPIRRPRELADAILEVLADADHYRALARTGRSLVQAMFDVRRTACEVYEIYEHLQDSSIPRPDVFDSEVWARNCPERPVA